MKKRLTIELDGEDFKAVLGAILKTSATFTVEHVGQLEPEAEARVGQGSRTGYRTASSIFLDTIEKRHKMHKNEMRRVLDEAGYGNNNVYSTAQKLFTEGKIRKDGDYYIHVPNPPGDGMGKLKNLNVVAQTGASQAGE